MKFNIAIDGHSSCGKSTIAKQLAKQLKFRYIDTGAMYRSVTLYAIEQGLISGEVLDKKLLISKLSDISIDFQYNINTETSEIFLNGVNVENKIRSFHVAEWVSAVSTITEVRKKLVMLQQEIAKNKNVVMDGRDIGTVVMPDALVKIFMTADAKVRANRRWLELEKKGDFTTLKEVLENINKRDSIDSNRKDSPLIQAEDAWLLDNSRLTIKEQFQSIFQYIEEKINDYKL